jgi:hypothetical protein
MGDDHAVFAERLRAYPAPVRDAVLRALLGHAQLARPDAVGMRVTGNIGLVQGLRRNPALMANTLAFAHQVDAPLLLAAMEREGGFREVARLIADPDRAARLDLRGLERLRAQLLRDGGWEAALRDLPPATSPAALPFDFGAHGTGRFGRIRLAPGLMEAAGEATGPEEIVTLLRPATGESRVMRPGAVLHVRESDADQEWLFRLGGRGAMQLREARQEEVQPAAAPTDAELPTVVRNRVYRVAAMERNRPGWLRVTDVTPGERLEISTFGLDRSVDTTVTIVRDSERLAYDDDGGTGLESLLTWEADRPGAVFLQLNNIGRPGGFSFMVTSGM